MIEVKHNIEVAHRLTKLPGRCQNIHGHSMMVHLQLLGEIDERGLCAGLDFAFVKHAFRKHLDSDLDHHLLLNKDDPFACTLNVRHTAGDECEVHWIAQELPGLQICEDDPTTENLARWIGEWATLEFKEYEIGMITTTVHETAVNAAKWSTIL